MESNDTTTKPNPQGFPYHEHSSFPQAHKGAALVVRFNNDGNYCLSGGRDRSIILWNPHRGLRVKEYSGVHGYEVLDVRVVSDNNKFASCGGDRVVYLWDVSTGRVIRRFSGHAGRVNTVRFSTTNNVLLSGSFDKTVKAWDLRSNMKDPIQTLDHFKDSVSSLAVADTDIFAASVDGCLRRYDLRMGRIIVDHVSQPLTSVRLSHDENCVLLSCLDSTLRLFDKSSGELLNEYKGHKQEKVSTESCLTNSDAYVISGSEDGIIYIWDLVEPKIVQTLKGHECPVTSIDFHPTECCLVSAAVDGAVKCWK